MKQLFSAYPAGLAGVALLLLRCSLALFLAMIATGILPLHWPALVLDALAILLAAGLSTRIIAALSAIAAIVILLYGACETPLLLLTQALDAAALALIGPGAFSIDARLFGRATVNLPR